MGYYDRQGQAITAEQWAATFKDKRVDQTTVGNYWISTVWLGIDHGWDQGLPLIFETMVFVQAGGADDQKWDQWQDRYHTEAAALIGHQAVVQAIEAGMTPGEAGLG